MNNVRQKMGIAIGIILVIILTLLILSNINIAEEYRRRKLIY